LNAKVNAKRSINATTKPIDRVRKVSSYHGKSSKGPEKKTTRSLSRVRYEMRKRKESCLMRFPLALALSLLLLASVAVVGNLVALRAVPDFASVGVDDGTLGNVRALAVSLLAGKEVVEGAAILEIFGDVAIKV